MNSREELQELVATRQSTLKLPTDIAHLDFYYKLIKGGVVVIIGVALWVGRLTWSINDIHAYHTKQDTKNTAYDTYIQSNNFANQTFSNSMGGLRDRIKGIEDWKAQVDPWIYELHFNLENGIPNDSAFFTHHGYRPSGMSAPPTKTP